MTTRICYFVLIIAVFLAVADQSRAQDLKLVELRKNFGMRYLQPDAHFALANYYIEKGNFVQAFFILEYARRYRFEEKDFDAEYFKFFRDPMPEPPANAKNAFSMAMKLATEQKYDEAEVYFLKASKIYDKSFAINIWTGRFYFKARSDSSRALPYYFKAYFLYPHAYETEHAESRIRTITNTISKEAFSQSLSRGKTYSDLVRDENPIIVGLAIGRIAEKWDADYTSTLLGALTDDESINRWSAFVTLQKKAGPSFDRIVDELLSDSDLRKRGLAAYALVERDGDQKFDLLEKMLSDSAELVRFDAVSALVVRCGVKGKQILTKHQRSEKQPRLKALIDHALKNIPK